MSLCKGIVVSRLLRDRKDGIRQERSVWIIWSIQLLLPLRTRTNEILFVKRNPNRVADSYFFPRCRSLVGNKARLKGRIVTCRQQTNVQASGVKLPLGVFVGQSFEHRHFGLSWSRPVLTLDV